MARWRCALSLVLVMCGGACVQSGDPVSETKGEGEAFSLRDPLALGKLDEASSLLPAEELQRLQDALSDAIAATDAEIADLESEIAKLERDNAQKAAEVDDLIWRVEQRRAQVQREWETKRNICLLCLFGGCSPVCFVSLAGMMDDDRVLEDLNRQLADARSRQSAIRSQMTDYRGRRDRLRNELSALQQARDELELALRGEPGQIPDALADVPELAHMTHRVSLLEAILDKSQEQVSILLRIRNLAQGVSDALDEAVATLSALATAADEAAQAARERTWDVLVAATSPDPGVAATEWLEDEVARRTSTLLQGMGWPVGDFVDALLKRRGDADAAVEELTRRLIEKLSGEVGVATWRVVTDSGAAVLDRATTTSVASIEASGRIREAGVEVDIRHTYIGDLVVSVEHAGVTQIVRQRTGGSRDDLEERFVLTDFGALPIGGDWALHVHDGADLDQGRLVRWTLDLVYSP